MEVENLPRHTTTPPLASHARMYSSSSDGVVCVASCRPLADSCSACSSRSSRSRHSHFVIHFWTQKLCSRNRDDDMTRR